MAGRADEHDDAEAVTRQDHENSWSASLEQPEHAENRDLIVEGALDAIEHTAPGYHVNLVTHTAHGHPESYLYKVLERAYDQSVQWEYVEQCGCGGHVIRAHVEYHRHGFRDSLLSA